MKSLKYIAVLGNILYTLLILQYGAGESVQFISKIEPIFLTGLVVLLVLNLAVMARIRI